MSKRLTIGMRCRFKVAWAATHSWSEYAGHECLLQERSSTGGFSVMVLGEGKNVELKKEDPTTVVNQVAWVNEEELEHINSDFGTNLDFMDWYQEHEEDFCGDCGAWFPNSGGIDPATDEDYVCPNRECPGRLYDAGLCPHCITVEAVDDKCPKCGFEFDFNR
jgi:hypothetical protein